MPSSNPANRFQDILDSIDDIEAFTRDMKKTQFAGDRKTRFAVERSLMILSEAAVKLGAVADELAPGVPWSHIRGLGNHIRHAYDDVNEDTIWEIRTHDLGPLRVACREALDRLAQVRQPDSGPGTANPKR